MPMDQFFDLVLSMPSLANNARVSIGGLPSYVAHLKRVIEEKKGEIYRLHHEIENEVQRKESTSTLSQKLQSLTQLLESRRSELEKVTKERDICQNVLESVRHEYQQSIWDKKAEVYEWHASPEEVKKAEIELSSGIDGDHYTSRLKNPGLKQIIQHLHNYPSKYVEPIRKVIDTYDSLHSKSIS
jgi:predicted RNase H-like nuclease (RuvC/YqgF family)